MNCHLPSPPPPVMDAQRRLQQVLGLDAAIAARAVAETLDALGLGVTEYITARHAQLQGQGICNTEIYSRIEAELPKMRFLAEPLTARQIRRRIYG